MAREENSVMSSLNQLLVDEQQRRTEQILVARQRKLQQEREVLEQQVRESEEARLRSERITREANERLANERAEQTRLEQTRQLELERIKSDLELGSRVALINLEQQHELERLAFQRDRRVARLEGQRGLLIALFGTMLFGLVVTYLLVFRPGTLRQEQIITSLSHAATNQRSEFERERERFVARLAERDATVVELKRLLDEARRTPAAVPEQATRTVASKRKKVVSKQVPICNENDPLCGTLKSR